MLKIRSLFAHFRNIFSLYTYIKTKIVSNMQILITTGTYNTSDYRVVKNYKTLKAAQKFAESKGYKGEIFNRLTFTQAGTQYKVLIG